MKATQMQRPQSASPTRFPNGWQRGIHSLRGDRRIFPRNLGDQEKVLTRAVPVSRNHDSQTQFWPQHFSMPVHKSGLCAGKVPLLLKMLGQPNLYACYTYNQKYQSSIEHKCTNHILNQHTRVHSVTALSFHGSVTLVPSAGSTIPSLS